MATDPTKVRMIQTRSGVVDIPREQSGTPLKEYFLNTELPTDLDRAVVLMSENGPVLAKADPVPWNEQHEKMATHYAEKIMGQIEERGYYSKTLDRFAGRLSDASGYAKDEMKAIIISKFEERYGRDPFSFLQDQREAQGLPTREPSTEHSQSQSPAPDYEQ